VETVDGPVLVIAGRGFGQDPGAHASLAHLIGHHGIPADRIMAITFTNKAAGEMAERVTGLVGARHAGRTWVTTFHKTGVRILRREAAALDLKSGFTIYDGQDAQRLIARLAKDAGIDDKRLLRARSRTRSAARRTSSSVRAAFPSAPAAGPTTGSRRSTRPTSRRCGVLTRSTSTTSSSAPSSCSVVTLTCSSVTAALHPPDDRRVPGHQPRAVPPGAAARVDEPQPDGRRRP
jgi:hypothetical protein